MKPTKNKSRSSLNNKAKPANRSKTTKFGVSKSHSKVIEKRNKRNQEQSQAREEDRQKSNLRNQRRLENANEALKSESHIDIDQPERIQKVLANIGLASRRQVEKWLSEGKIKVNGRQAKLGDKIISKDKVEYEGKVVSILGTNNINKNVKVLLMNKPVGYLCSQKEETNLPEKRANQKQRGPLDGNRSLIFDLLPKLDSNEGRWVQVGRLDLNTSGLLLFTNNGALANKLMHPSSNIERVYHCRVHGQMTPENIAKLKKGVSIDDGKPAKFRHIEALNANKLGTDDDEKVPTNTWWKVAISEGRNREVRKMFDAVGMKVNRLMRVRYGTIWLPERLPTGQYQLLTDKQVVALKSDVGLD